MKLVTADQMRDLEGRADQSGNTYAMMMERAGHATADAILARVPPAGKSVLVLVGPGNNGGDGLVCARYLHQAGARVSLYLWKRVPKEADENWKLCLSLNIPAERAEEDEGFDHLRQLVRGADVLVDALLGTGVGRPIDGLLKEVLEAAKAEIAAEKDGALQPVIPGAASPRPRPLVAAVDLPSGLNPDTGALDPSALPADLTVTFACPKIGQLSLPGAAAVGDLIVADIGIRSDSLDASTPEVASAREVGDRLPKRARDSHKGTFGKAMLCVGSANYVGAAFLSGSAATRAGAGLVTLALARAVYSLVAPAVHETTYLVLPDDLGVLVPDAASLLRDHLEGYDVLLIGCGFGRDPKTVELVRRLLELGSRARSQVGFVRQSEDPGRGRAKLPQLVIDADALFALRESGEWWTSLGPDAAILTPHPGEMATLTGRPRDEVQGDRIGVAREFAARWKQVVVLKGAFTVVAAPDGRVTLIPFATPALATAGTGDVLAGTIAAMVAQGLAPFDAAVAGAYVHGLAGEIAEKEIGAAGVVAGDLLPRLPAAIRRLSLQV